MFLSHWKLLVMPCSYERLVESGSKIGVRCSKSWFRWCLSLLIVVIREAWVGSFWKFHIFFEKKFLCYLPSRCSSVENNLLAASDGVEICPVVFRNLAFISNAESNYDIIFLEDDLNFFSPMFCLGEWGFPHYINVMVVYNWFLTRSLPCF